MKYRHPPMENGQECLSLSEAQVSTGADSDITENRDWNCLTVKLGPWVISSPHVWCLIWTGTMAHVEKEPQPFSPTSLPETEMVSGDDHLASGKAKGTRGYMSSPNEAKTPPFWGCFRSGNGV